MGTKRKTDTVYFLLGFVKWHMDLISYLVDEIFSLSDALEERQLTETCNANTLKDHSECLLSTSPWSSKR